MSKVIHWNIPFQSVNGVDYSLYIIDENGPTISGTPDVIQAGDTPFTTEEDTNTDFFSPVRGSTGTISIVDTDGTIMSSMIPDNNTARSIQLVKIVNNVQSIAWQGFLTCNTYSQGYTYRPQICELQAASLLEAADSISANQTDFVGLMTVRQIITKCISAIQSEYGYGTIFNTIYFPKADWRILYFYINTSIFFDEKEVSNENLTNYITVGKSVKEILTMVCTFMGWCVRECPNKILSFQRLNDQNATNYYYISYSDFSDDNKALGTYLHPGTKDSVSIQNLSYRGTGHDIETTAGAKSVEIVAKLEKYALNLGLLPFPYGSTSEIYQMYDGQHYIYILASTVNNPYNNVALRYYKATVSYVHGEYGPVESTTLNDLLANIWNATEIVDIYEGSGTATVRSGAFFAKVAYEDQHQASHSTNEGLFVSWLPPMTNAIGYILQPIFSMKTTRPLTINNGYVKLTASMTNLVVNYSDDYEVVWITKETEYTNAILMSIRIGNKYWNGSGWISQFTKIWIPIEDNNFKKNWDPSMPVEETDGYIFPLFNTLIDEELEIAIYPFSLSRENNKFLINTFFSDLRTEYLQKDDETKTDRGENRYFSLLGTNFSDQISINTALATDMNNIDSPSILMYTQNEKMQYMTYSYPDGDTTNRPERDLLARLAKYYKKKRRTIQVEVEQINEHLPITRVTDGSIQLQPLAESMDWALDKATVTLMEESADSET